MTADFSALLIPTFPGINDQPISPTATRAGNGAHLIKSYNDLINKLNSNSSAWKIVRENYEANTGDRVVVLEEANNPIAVFLPSSPTTGNSVTLLIYSGSVYLNNIPKFSHQDVIEVYLDQVFEEVDLIYIDDVYGWVTNKPNVFQVRDASNPFPA